MGSHLSKYDDLPLATAAGGLEPLPTGGRWVRPEETTLTLRAKIMSWTHAECDIYEGDGTGGERLLRIEGNDLRDRAVYDSTGVEIPTGYRRRLAAAMAVAHIYYETEGKVMCYASVKKIFQLRPAFGVFLHNPPVELNPDDTKALEENLETPDLTVECSAMGHFVILQGDPENNPIKVATVKKENTGWTENFPLHITIGPKVSL